jgi:ECF sigma factor
VAKTPQGLTIFLSRARAGDERAPGELIALIDDELRRVASRLLHRERAGHNLPPTAVVHEAVIRLPGEAVFDRVADRAAPSSPRLRSDLYALEAVACFSGSEIGHVVEVGDHPTLCRRAPPQPFLRQCT